METSFYFLFSYSFFLRHYSEDTNGVITIMPEGTLISDDLQLTLGEYERYELKPVDPCTVPVFNKKLNKFLKTLPVISTKQFLSGSQ